MRTNTLTIDGMSCDHCVQAVTEALQTLDDVAVDNVTIGEARVQYDDSDVDPADLFSAIDEAGFSVTSLEMD